MLVMLNSNNVTAVRVRVRVLQHSQLREAGFEERVVLGAVHSLGLALFRLRVGAR